MLDNIVPTLAQIAFFPYSAVVFGRLDRATATAVVVLSGLLFLPEITIFSLSDAVQIGKDRIIYLGALFGIVVHQNRALRISKPILSIAAVLIPMMIVNVLTWEANPKTVFSQGAFRIGLSWKWILGQSIQDFFMIALPFVIAKAAFVSYKDLRALLYVLVGFGIFYTALIIIELVMAIPFRVFQFSNRIYDIPFRPTFRYGLTEPVVFLGLGHTVATFMALAVIAAAGFRKIGKPVSWARIEKARVITGVGLLATLKVGGVLMGFVAVMIFAIFKPRKIALIAGFSAAMICAYPVMQIFDIFPEDVLVEIATKLTNVDRVRSFNGRFEEEEFVLDGLGGRLFSGWGTYARIPGADTNIGSNSGEPGLDAWWVIKVGISGILGVEVILLLMAIPIWQARKRIASIQSDETILLLGVLMMSIVVRMADLMMNGWWNSLPVFLAGALYGICKHAHRLSDESTSSGDEPRKKRIQRYASGAQTD